MFKRKKKTTPVSNDITDPKLPFDTTIRCLVKRGTTKAWEEADPILDLNELASEYSHGKLIGYKLGDGATRWSKLDYVTNIADLKEFWIYCNGDQGKYLAAKIVLNPFVIEEK